MDACVGRNRSAVYFPTPALSALDSLARPARKAALFGGAASIFADDCAGDDPAAVIARQPGPLCLIVWARIISLPARAKGSFSGRINAPPRPA